MEADIYQIDAFTDKVFGGNPAAVVPFETWPDDKTLLNIAAENNLSETAFFIPDGERFHLRWFTPTTEVDLCGHGTLSAAYVLFEELKYEKDAIEFDTQSGRLIVTKTENGMTLDFPIWERKAIDMDARFTDALGHEPKELYMGPDWVAVYDDAQIVAAMTPDMMKLNAIEEARGIIVTAPGENGVDFVSRFFGPRIGIPEDPVTGSAHCILTPLWSEKLGKSLLKAQQISARGGDLICELVDDRVKISGNAVTYFKGKIYIPD